MKRSALIAALLVFSVSTSARTGFAQVPQVPETRAEIQLSFSPVVKETAPSVVNIYASRVVEERFSPFAGDPFFSQFFRSGPARQRVQRSLGSGVIVSEDGLVVSNYHVVGEASDIRVVLSDKREYKGEVILADKEADVAVLRLDGASDLPALPLADSDALEVGDLVLAIGNPFGVGQTVSSGIVSGLARSGSAIPGGAGSYIQTDAAINPGNSGGALVDMSGRLVGINTSILSRSGGSNGIGFAIPANLVREFTRQAEAGQTRFIHPWSGVTTQAVDDAVAEALGLDRPEGVVLAELHPQSPFAALGLTAGDVLLSLDGQPVLSPSDLEYRLSILPVGSKVKLSALRAGEPVELELSLIAAPGSDKTQRVEIRSTGPLGGMVVADVTPALIDEYGLSLKASGVVLLEAQGASARLGLQRGDRIVEVNNMEITTAEDLQKVARQRSSMWLLTVDRGGRLLRMRVR
ncbi:Do family serine endopeptidase [Celeribacter halophilus]|uniref:Do family serine endopeptidase n=1 Tax=Celeribacter halophilus TaxID=576117 RepID=UPI001C08FC8D|nr:Do family serine endopeptidase [Celeribacter halophilus]MBU2891049.1 Do family serine endopeptidase [Celeribacter halophilus]MDO6511064.1 Do family serine endopeptidase [Celeribacter halophilus]